MRGDNLLSSLPPLHEKLRCTRHVAARNLERHAAFSLGEAHRRERLHARGDRQLGAHIPRPTLALGDVWAAPSLALPAV